MNKLDIFTIPALLVGAAMNIHAATDPNTLVVTATNATKNQLLVYNSAGALLQTVSTGGQGGASGNAGGITAKGGLIAVVNFGSDSVSIFERAGNGVQMRQSVSTVAKNSPVSVAFGNGHLYVLGTTKVESHQMFGNNVSTSADGIANLLLGDGSAAQVGVVQNQLIFTEKTGDIETVNLTNDGAITGTSTLVKNIPANPLAPFGLVTRGNDAYVTIAHSNEITLVRNDTVLTVTGSGTQNAPCWLALDGPFLFSSNSPSMSISRYAVYGQKIVQDAAVAASLGGDPTDIASRDGLVAVVDANSTVSHVSFFSVDEDGNLALKSAVTLNNLTQNGIAIIPGSFGFVN